MRLIRTLSISFLIYCAILQPGVAKPIKQPRVGGTIQLDAVYINDDKAELVPGSGTEVRRARLFAIGQYETWQYKLRAGFEEDDLSLKDAYMKHISTGIKLGLFKPSFSIDEVTSSKYITFMERAFPNAFKPGRRIGIGYHKYTNQLNINFGLFGQGSDEGDSGDEGFGINARITHPVIFNSQNLLHVGFGLTLENPEDDINNSISFSSRPESHITGDIVETGTITNTKTIVRSGIEISSVIQSVSIQAEAIKVDLFKNDNSKDLSFSGSYVYASWFLTGEQRPYKAEHGAFGRIKPIAAEGAWELALRYSKINLNDDVIIGAKATNITLGVNWYTTKNTRFSMNYIDITTDENNIYGNPEILQFRAQIDF